MPPSEAPGPTGVLQTMLPLSGLSAQKMPPFWPKPTISPTRLGPDPPRSKSGLLGTGQFGFGPEEVRHATVQVSKPCSFFAHLMLPVFKSNARSSDDGGWMCPHLCDPPQYSCFSINRDYVRAVGTCLELRMSPIIS